jgi:hypothetical protein
MEEDEFRDALHSIEKLTTRKRVRPIEAEGQPEEG